MSTKNSITIGLTGASGMLYSLRLMKELIKLNQPINIVMTAAAHVVLSMEHNLHISCQPREIKTFFLDYLNAQPDQLQVYGRDQWNAPIASGSAVSRAMVVCPCTSGTLAAIANGLSDNLLERAADVVIKEQRKLILVHRETPVSAIHLEQMLKLAQLGAVILPANPGFYHQPESIDDLVDFIVARILDHLALVHNVGKRWGQADK